MGSAQSSSKMERRNIRRYIPVCGALTNHHILVNPVRVGDVSIYKLHRNQLHRDGILCIQKKAERQKQLCQLRVVSFAIAADENDEVDDNTRNDSTDDPGLLDSINN